MEKNAKRSGTDAAGNSLVPGTIHVARAHDYVRDAGILAVFFDDSSCFIFAKQ